MTLHQERNIFLTVLALGIILLVRLAVSIWNNPMQGPPRLQPPSERMYQTVPGDCVLFSIDYHTIDYKCLGELK